MPRPCSNKFRDALAILQKGRDLLVDELAEAVVSHGDELLESPFLMTELLEGHGSKLQFLLLLMSQLERSAEDREIDEAGALELSFGGAPESDGVAAPSRRRRRRRRGGRGRKNRGKLEGQGSPGRSPKDLDF